MIVIGHLQCGVTTVGVEGSDVVLTSELREWVGFRQRNTWWYMGCVGVGSGEGKDYE